MKFADIKDLTVEELRKRERAGRSELREMKLKHVMGQVANPLEIRFRRRDIARVKTALAAKLK
jgi:large subunit ribosomal protein L29